MRKKIIFFASLKSTKNGVGSGVGSGTGSGSIIRGTDPDPHQNVTDPQHCFEETLSHEKRTWVRLVVKKRPSDYQYVALFMCQRSELKVEEVGVGGLGVRECNLDGV